MGSPATDTTRGASNRGRSSHAKAQFCSRNAVQKLQPQGLMQMKSPRIRSCKLTYSLVVPFNKCSFMTNTCTQQKSRFRSFHTATYTLKSVTYTQQSATLLMIMTLPNSGPKIRAARSNNRCCYSAMRKACERERARLVCTARNAILLNQHPPAKETAVRK